MKGENEIAHARADFDRIAFGAGYVRLHRDGHAEHIPVDEILVYSGDHPGDPVTIAELRQWWKDRQ